MKIQYKGAVSHLLEHAHNKAIPKRIREEDAVDEQLAFLHGRLLHHVGLGFLAGQAQGLEGEKEGRWNKRKSKMSILNEYSNIQTP